MKKSCLSNVHCMDCDLAGQKAHICDRCKKEFFCEPSDLTVSLKGCTTTYSICMKCAAFELREMVMHEERER